MTHDLLTAAATGRPSPDDRLTLRLAALVPTAVREAQRSIRESQRSSRIA